MLTCSNYKFGVYWVSWHNKRGILSFQYPNNIGNGRFTIADVRDLTTGYDSSRPDKQAVLPASSSSQMITFYFSNGCVLTLRTSGTEPKIKYYSEMCAKPEQE